MTGQPRRPPDPPSSPASRELAWEYQLRLREGIAERYLGVLADLWRRSRAGQFLAFVLAPLWLVGLVLGLAVAFAVGVFILALIAVPFALVGYVIYVAIDLLAAL